jgi:hypothetical protein
LQKWKHCSTNFWIISYKNAVRSFRSQTRGWWNGSINSEHIFQVPLFQAN